MKHIDDDMRGKLLTEMKDYLKGFPDATKVEKHELRSWVTSGRSPYDNRWELYNDYGWPLDFISAERIGQELIEDFKNSPGEAQENTSNFSDELPF